MKMHVARRNHENIVEGAISFVLRWGVRLCAALMAIGIAVGALSGSPAFSSQFLLALKHGGLIHVDCGTIISAGIVVLIALPFLRVALTVVLFAWERDFLYMIFSMVVLFMLVCGIVTGTAI